jgi:hypothetical protein
MVEKSKLHPFASHLRRGEEILWMSSPSSQMNLERREVLYAVIGTVGLFIVTVLMFARRALTPGNTLPFMIHLAYELSPCCALLAMVFLPTVWALKQRWPTDYDYAVTNLRLLHRYKDQVQTIRLEEIPSVTLLLTGSKHGNLRFGDAFPGWYDLDDAARIQHIIQDARERRLEGV